MKSNLTTGINLIKEILLKSCNDFFSITICPSHWVNRQSDIERLEQLGFFFEDDDLYFEVGRFGLWVEEYTFILLDGPNKGESLQAREYLPCLHVTTPTQVNVKEPSPFLPIRSVVQYHAVKTTTQGVVLYSINPNFFENEKA